jgi:hypothetical protein
MRVRVATFRVLSYWLRIWNPYQYHDWVATGERIAGPDILERIEPAMDEAYIRSVLSTTGLVLAFPQYEIVVRQNQRAWFGGEAYRSMVLKGLYLRLYLERGIQRPLPWQRLREVRQHYPECLEKLAELQRNALAKEGCLLPDLRFRGFCLLKEIAVAVDCALTAASFEAHAFRLPASAV